MIDSDDPVTSDLLGGLLELLAESGGWLNPSARLVARDGQLSVHADSGGGDLLVHVPRDLLVRVGRIDWSAANGVLTPVAVSPEIQGLELEALFVLTGLLNQCGKLTDLLQHHPLLASDLPSSVTQAVAALRPGFGQAHPDPVSLLWSTRCFRVSFDDGPPEPVAVPILELLNHRAGGATALPHGGGLAATMAMGAAEECVLDYGRHRDALSMALVYGFADSSAQLAHSAPLSIDVSGLGKAVVAARGRDGQGGIIPMTVIDDGEQVLINRMIFGPSFAPVSELMACGGFDVGQARSIVNAVREANIALLEKVSAAVSEAPAAVILSQAARIQLSVMKGARVEDSSYEPTTLADSPTAAITEDDHDLGRWLGEATREG